MSVDDIVEPGVVHVDDELMIEIVVEEVLQPPTQPLATLDHR